MFGANYFGQPYFGQISGILRIIQSLINASTNFVSGFKRFSKKLY